MIQFQENTPEDGQTLIYGTTLATTRGPTSITAVDWHLKNKDTEYHVGLGKNYYVTTSMLKITSIHIYSFLRCSKF